MNVCAFRRPLATALGLLGLLGISIRAQTLVRDFDPTPTAPWSSHPRSFQVLPNGNTLFLAGTIADGDALWITDGTAAGTTLLVDLVPGPLGSFLGALVPVGNGSFVFTADVPGSGAELWRTDGTANGTVLLADINPGSAGSNPTMFRRVGNQVVFAADNGTAGAELWATDGTTTGTRMIRDLIAGPGSALGWGLEVAAIGAMRFVFVYPNDTRLWVSDFTTAGTQPIGTATGGSGLRSFGNRALFRGAGAQQPECWVSDGTASGTFSLGAYCDADIQIAGNQAFFRGWTGSTGFELWRTDGTIAGTTLVVDLTPGAGAFQSSRPWLVGAIQNDVLFFATTFGGSYLFRSNGTLGGTIAISNIANPGTFYGSDWGTSFQGWLYYRIQSGSQTELYRTDGTPAGTMLVADFSTGAEVGVVGNALLFGGDDGSGIGTELWTSGGTAASTQLLRDLAPGNGTESSSPAVTGTFRDSAIVRATTAASGTELWITDGTAAGTQQLVDLVPGPGSSAALVAANDRQLMIVQSGGFYDGDPWFSDGTPAGTTQLDLFPANSGFFAGQPAAFGDRFVFAGSLPGLGSEPWITDGTIAGTSMLRDIAPGAIGSGPDQWLQLGANMLFRVNTPNGYGLWTTDGTPGGTLLLGSLGTYSWNSSFQPFVFDGRAYFAANSATQGIELFRTDGTVAGTGLVADLEPGSGSSRPFGFAAIGSRLLFLAEIGGQMRMLALDGPTGVVTALSATNPARPWTIDDATAAFFTGTQLWRTDGTDAGTALVRTFAELHTWPQPRRLGNERLLFVARDGYSGLELWSTNGTAAGTIPVTALVPGQPGIQDFVRAGAAIVLTGDDGIHGNELLAIPFVASGDWVFERYGSGCPGSGGISPAIGYTGAARVTTAPPFAMNLTGARPNSLALLALGWQRGAVPIPGCTVWLDSAAVLLTVPTDLAGAAAVPFVLPPAALGTRFTGQWFALDPAGTAFGLLAATAAAEVVVGS